MKNLVPQHQTITQNRRYRCSIMFTHNTNFAFLAFIVFLQALFFIIHFLFFFSYFLLFFFLMIRRPPRSTPFPTRRSSVFFLKAPAPTPFTPFPHMPSSA